MSDFSEKLTQSPETGEPVGDFKTTPVEAEFTSLPAKTKGKLKVKKTSKAPFKKNYSQEDSLFDSEGELTVDIFETEKNIVIQSAIAGIDADDLDISIEKDMVAIKGKREKCLEEKVENYFCQECYWGKFSKEIILPVETDTANAEAVIKNGILTITVPKIKREKIKKLGIKEIE